MKSMIIAHPSKIFQRLQQHILQQSAAHSATPWISSKDFAAQFAQYATRNELGLLLQLTRQHLQFTVWRPIFLAAHVRGLGTLLSGGLVSHSHGTLDATRSRNDELTNAAYTHSC